MGAVSDAYIKSISYNAKYFLILLQKITLKRDLNANEYIQCVPGVSGLS